jgi:hypothetical protein
MSSAPKLISLKHIKESAAAMPPRKAWPGGTIGSNKDEAIARFLEKKRAQGGALTPEQLEILRRFHSVEAAAKAERIAKGLDSNDDAGAAHTFHHSASSGQKRRREPIVIKGKTPSSGRPVVSVGVTLPPPAARSKPSPSRQSPGAKAPPAVVSHATAAAASSKSAAPSAAPAPSIVDKLSMSLDQLAAMRRAAPAAAAPPIAHKKQRK